MKLYFFPAIKLFVTCYWLTNYWKIKTFLHILILNYSFTKNRTQHMIYSWFIIANFKGILRSLQSLLPCVRSTLLTHLHTVTVICLGKLPIALRHAKQASLNCCHKEPLNIKSKLNREDSELMLFQINLFFRQFYFNRHAYFYLHFNYFIFSPILTSRAVFSNYIEQEFISNKYRQKDFEFS